MKLIYTVLALKPKAFIYFFLVQAGMCYSTLSPKGRNQTKEVSSKNGLANIPLMFLILVTVQAELSERAIKIVIWKMSAITVVDK